MSLPGIQLMTLEPGHGEIAMESCQCYGNTFETDASN